jgi:hypothetical protein
MNFNYGKLDLREVEVTKSNSNVYHIDFEGGQATLSDRFWRSFFSKFGVSQSIFSLFDYKEVFDRAVDRREQASGLRYCLEKDDLGNSKMLGLSNLGDDLLDNDRAHEIVDRHSGTNAQYSDGVLTSVYTPRSGEHAFKIGGDDFNNKYMLEIPIDGFQKPRSFLSLLRQICSNGMVAHAPAFRTEIQTGKEGQFFSLNRFLESYDNTDGFQVLGVRMASAQTSWASIREADLVKRSLLKANIDYRIMHKFDTMVGDIADTYGIATIDSISPKKQATLPSKAKVYDLINFITEVGTHMALPSQSRAINGVLGTLISNEYDLEGSVDHVSDFKDFFVKAG